MEKENIAVIFGGRSCEHDISIITGLQVLHNINTNKYNVLPIYIDKDGVWWSGEALKNLEQYKTEVKVKKGIFQVALFSGCNILHKKQFKKWKSFLKINCAVLTLHGMNGEDGKLQGILELCNIPYTSSGVLGSSVCMDKVIMKRVFESLKLPIVEWFYVRRDKIEEQIDDIDKRIETSFKYPAIIKPANLGSSIGIGVCHKKDELLEKLLVAKEYDDKIIIERCIINLKEVNCAVLGYKNNITLATLEEPISYKEFLNFNDKYISEDNFVKGMKNLKRKMPANITKVQQKLIKTLSKKAFYELECAGVVRIDYIIDNDTNKVYINEVNTIPGSLAFYLWEYDGVYFPVLIDKLITFAKLKYDEYKKNKFTYLSNVLQQVNKGSKNK